MTAPHIVDPARLLGDALSGASPDLMRHLLGTVINALLCAEADAVCGAEYGVASAPGSGRMTRGGVPARWVAGDGVYGAEPQLRSTLAAAEVGFTLAVAHTPHHYQRSCTSPVSGSGLRKASPSPNT